MWLKNLEEMQLHWNSESESCKRGEEISQNFVLLGRNSLWVVGTCANGYEGLQVVFYSLSLNVGSCTCAEFQKKGRYTGEPCEHLFAIRKRMRTEEILKEWAEEVAGKKEAGETYAQMVMKKIPDEQDVDEIINSNEDKIE